MRAALLLGAVLALTACTEAQPGVVEARPVPSSTPGATSTAPSGPTDHELGAALPVRREVGVGGFTSCVTGVDVCDADPSTSWVRAVEGVAFAAGSRWVQITVGRPNDAAGTLQTARSLCERGRFVLPPDPRGSTPRPETWRGIGSRRPVERAGFRGVRCATALHPVGGAWHEEHRITAVRDDVRLDVQASSEALAVRLFEEYVDRLGWT